MATEEKETREEKNTDPKGQAKESQERDEGGEGDDDRVRVERDKDGETSVVVASEGRREERARKRREEMASVYTEHSRPILSQMEEMRRTVESLASSLQRGSVASAAAPAPQQTSKSEEVDPDFMRIRRRQGEIISLMRQARPGEVEHLEREYYQLDAEALDVRAKKLVSEKLDEYRRTNPPQEPREFRQLRNEFPDVVANPRAMNLAGAIYQAEYQRAVLRGKPFDEMDIHRNALRTAAEELGIRRAAAPPPKAHEQARFGGAPSNGAGSAGDVRRTLSREERGLALAWGKEKFGKSVAPEKAETEWAKMMAKADPDFAKA